MATNGQQIQQFNQRNQAAATGTTAPAPQGNNPPAPAPQPNNPPAPAPGGNNPPAPAPRGNNQPRQPQVRLNSRMSTSDIILLQKDPATLTKSEAIRRKAIETRENLRAREDIEERQRQQQLEADRRQGRFDRVLGSEIGRGFRALDKTTSAPRSWIMRAPTVGGIGALLAIIVLFLFAVVPVDNNGNTRLFLIWLTLTGKASVKPPPGAQSNVTPNISSTTVQPQDTVVDTTTNVPPDVTFTLPTIFSQNGNSGLFDSLFN